MSEIATPIWVLLALAAALVGFAKTAVGGLASVTVAVFAAVLPARASTATLLLLLLVGDLLAVGHYRRDCDRAILRRLLPAVVPGLLLGAVVLALVDDVVLRRLIGAILLLLLALQLLVSARDRRTSQPRTWSTAATAGVGVAAGLTTMVANAGGPVTTLYLLSRKVDKLRFLGTSAWFFFCVNLCKLPFSAGLGLINRSTLSVAAVLAPCVVVGAGVGVVTARRMRQRTFDRVVLVASVLSAVPLLLP